MNRQTSFYLFAIVLAGLFLSAGCHQASRYMSQDHGQYYKAAFSQQVVNPDAPEDRRPVDTLPGAVGSKIYQKRYVDTLTTEQKDHQESVGQQLRDLN
jgi:hypothetical protein